MISTSYHIRLRKRDKIFEISRENPGFLRKRPGDALVDSARMYWNHDNACSRYLGALGGIMVYGGM
jgi:hypothetical protein